MVLKQRIEEWQAFGDQLSRERQNVIMYSWKSVEKLLDQIGQHLEKWSHELLTDTLSFLKK